MQSICRAKVHPRLAIFLAVLRHLTLVISINAGLSQAATASTPCSTVYTINNENKDLANCQSLAEQAAMLAWTLDQERHTLDVIFGGTAPNAGGWVGWGINLGDRPAMIGAQTFIAFQAANGSTLLTYNVTAETMQGVPLMCTPISLHILDSQVQISGGGKEMLIWVSLQLRPNQSTSLHHVWNRGESVSNFRPGVHAFSSADLSALKTIDMTSGIASSATVRPVHLILKNRHGVLNTVGWGLLLPLGVMAARYLRPFTDPAWFYLHVLVQLAGYAVGLAGWATGLRVGTYSVGVVYRKHRLIAIVLFALASLQVTAVLLRPKKDHKIRKAWNFYHYTVGASIVVLGILNIFYGFDILSLAPKWRQAYIGVLIALALLALALEMFVWVHAWLTTKRRSKMQGAHVGGIPRGMVKLRAKKLSTI